MHSRPHLNSFVFLLVFQHLLTGVHLSSDFGQLRHPYKRDTHEEDGFSKGICKTGKSQSPIDIDLSLAVTVYHWEPFMFNHEYKQKSLLKIKNDGHTVKASLLPMLKHELPTIWGGGLRGRFVFEQLHFHWGAEHTIDGKRHPLEMHLVHYNDRYKNMTEALKHQDGVAVFAVLFDHSSPKSVEMENFFHWVRDNLIYGDDSGELAQTNFITDIEPSPRPYFYLRNMLPDNVNKFIRYNGSLTTPPCSEVVQWTVMLDRFYVPEWMLKDFQKLKDHHGHLILKNYREVQPFNDRIMFIKKGDSTKNEGQSITGKKKLITPASLAIQQQEHN